MKKKRKTIAKGKYKRFISEGGWEFTERLNTNGVVAILAMTENSKIIFVEQYRIPVAKRVIEFPAGLVDTRKGSRWETLEETAHRELEEETGYSAKRLVLVTEGPASAGSLADVITFFRAHGLKKISKGGGDSMEDITVHEVSCEQVDKWLEAKRRKGYLIDPKIYTGLYFLRKEEEK